MIKLMVLLLIVLGALGGLIAVISFFVAVIKLFRKQKSGWGFPVTGFIGGSILAAGCAVAFGIFVLQKRDEIVETVAGEGKALLTTAVEAGTTGLSEGIEGTVIHFEGKSAEKLKIAAASMSVEVISAAPGEVEIAMQNSGSESVRLSDLVEQGLLLCTDSSGFDHFFEIPNSEETLLPPSSKTRHQLRVKSPGGTVVAAVKLVGHDPTPVP